MRLVRIDGELAEVVPTAPGHAKLVYLACEPEGGHPTEIEYERVSGADLGRRQRVTLKSANVLLVERVEPDLRHPLNFQKLVRKLLAKFGL